MSLLAASSLRVRVCFPGAMSATRRHPASHHACPLHAPSRHALAHAQRQGLPIDRLSGYSARDFRVAYVPVRFQLCAPTGKRTENDRRGAWNYSSTPPIYHIPILPLPFFHLRPFVMQRQNGSLRLLVRHFWPACYFSAGMLRGDARSQSQWSNCDMARRYRSLAHSLPAGFSLVRASPCPCPSCARASTAVLPRQDV